MPKDKDVNPQFLSFTVTETAPNTFTQVIISVPTIQSMGDEHALVLEILKMFLFIENPEFINAISTTVSTQISNKSQTILIALNDASALWRDESRSVNVDTGLTDGTLAYFVGSQWRTIDFTDGAGNGILFGGKNLFAALVGANNTGAKTFTGKILYRLKRVKASELIGILQE